MPTYNNQVNASLGGASFGATRNVSGTTPLLVQKDAFPVALAGTLTTRTAADQGVMTFATNPGLVAGNRVDVYWDLVGGAPSPGARRGMLVSSVAGAGPYTVTVGTAAGDRGTGDNFPNAADAITLGIVQTFELLFTGNNAKALAAACPTKGIIVLADNANAELWSAVFKVANIAGVKTWDNLDGSANPLAGVSVAKAFMSHGDNLNTRQLQVGVLE